MDLAQVRDDLRAVMQAAGYNAYKYIPLDVNKYPAAFSGVPSTMAKLTLTRWQITLPLTLLFNSASPEDAQRRLDVALTPGTADSVYDALTTLTRTTGAAWTSLKFVGAGNVRTVKIGNGNALACDITLELTG